MRRRLAPTFESEADLCSTFIVKVEQQPWNKQIIGTWTCYAETEGWDILMVRDEDGCQIGIEAKLDLNIAVIVQAIKDSPGHSQVGPDFRAVLIPAERMNHDLSPICHGLGITVITIPYDPEKYWHFHPHPPALEMKYDELRDWHPCIPMKRHRLPEYVPDVIAGASAPVQLSRWKIAALKLCVLLEDGPVNRADFKALGLSPTRWISRDGWLTPTSEGWVRGSRMPDFPAQHPSVYAEIKADREKWSFPRTDIRPQGQGTLGLENEI